MAIAAVAPAGHPATGRTKTPARIKYALPSFIDFIEWKSIPSSILLLSSTAEGPALAPMLFTCPTADVRPNVQVAHQPGAPWGDLARIWIRPFKFRSSRDLQEICCMVNAWRNRRSF